MRRGGRQCFLWGGCLPVEGRLRGAGVRVIEGRRVIATLAGQVGVGEGEGGGRGGGRERVVCGGEVEELEGDGTGQAAGVAEKQVGTV